MAKQFQVPVVAVVGSYASDVVLRDGMTVHSLVETFGPDQAYEQTTQCLTNLGTQILNNL